MEELRYSYNCANYAFCEHIYSFRLVFSEKLAFLSSCHGEMDWQNSLITSQSKNKETFGTISQSPYSAKSSFRYHSDCVKSVRIHSFTPIRIFLHFPIFGLNTDRYSVSLRIQPE